MPIGSLLSPLQNTQTDDEKKYLTHVLARKEQMQSARTVLDKSWNIYEMQYEANFVPYSDGRPRINVPLERAIIELFAHEAISRVSKPIIQAIWESDIEKVEVLKRVLDVVESQSSIQEQLYKNEFLTAQIGTGFYLTGFTKESRVISDIDYDENWDEVFKNKLLKKNRIVIKALDPRFVFLDDRTNDFDYDNDQIYIDYITPEQLESYKYDKSFKNIDKVGLWNGPSDYVFFTKEEQGKLHTGIIEIMHYWNKVSDKYVVIANRNTVIRDTPLPYAHKELPIVPRQYGYNPLGKYGTGLCEALLTFKSHINNLQEMIMEGIDRSNNSMFFISNGLTFDGQNFGFNNSIVRSDGPLDDSSFREIRGQQPNNAIFQYSQDLLRQVAIYVGIDPASIIGQASSTAFETAVRVETGLKRVNIALMNRDMALTKVYRRHVSNVMQFFPLKTAQGIVEAGTEEKYPTIMLDGENFVNGEFVELPGNFPFEISPDIIRGQFDIRVETNFNAPTLKQLKLERYNQFCDTVIKLSQLEQIPEFKEKIPMNNLLDEIAFDYDIDIKSFGGVSSGLKKEKEKLMEQVRTMAGVGKEQLGQMGVQQAGSLPEQAPEQEEVIRKKIGGIMSPATPNMEALNPMM